MGSLKNKKVAKINSKYMEQHEEHKISASRRKKLLVRRLTVFSIFAAILSYAIISTLISQSQTMEEMEKENLKVQQELTKAKKQETALRGEIVKLNDDEYLAKLARKEFFLSEDGEVIFTIPDDKKEKSSD